MQAVIVESDPEDEEDTSLDVGGAKWRKVVRNGHFHFLAWLLNVAIHTCVAPQFHMQHRLRPCAMHMAVSYSVDSCSCTYVILCSIHVYIRWSHTLESQLLFAYFHPSCKAL